MRSLCTCCTATTPKSAPILMLIRSAHLGQLIWVVLQHIGGNVPTVHAAH